MKELESLWELKEQSSGNPYPALAEYADNFCMGLVFCNKVFCFINNNFSSTKTFFANLLTYYIHSGAVHI